MNFTTVSATSDTDSACYAGPIAAYWRMGNPRHA